MLRRKTRARKQASTTSRVCPNCAMILDQPVKRCPRCDAQVPTQREENIVDKTSVDSFPASDPPQY
jgi:uncharacterized paraquat-inducible protein A